jgi:HSP20 family protein
MALRGTGLAPFTGTDFAPLFSFRRELDRLFNDRFSSQSGLPGWAPAADVREDSNNISLDVELPGISPDDVEINVDNGVLTISGQKQTEHRENEEDQRYHTVERTYGAFFRSFQLPQGVDEGQINASFNNGVLTIDIPKSALPQPRKISIGSGNRQVSSGTQGREQASGRSGSGRTGSKGDRMVASGREDDEQQSPSPQGSSSRQRQSK